MTDDGQRVPGNPEKCDRECDKIWGSDDYCASPVFRYKEGFL